MNPGEALLMPRLQTRNGQSQLAAERIQGLAAKQAEDGLDLACGVPSAGPEGIRVMCGCWYWA